MRRWLATLALLLTGAAHADAVDELRAFVRDVKSGTAAFMQTVTSPDGARKKVSQGRFDFARPNRFRFVYTRPFEQTIVADGEKVWIHDPDLNQVSSRAIAKALGATPAALLAGGSLEQDFVLTAQAPANGQDWVLAEPRAKDGVYQRMRLGLKNGVLATAEIVDSFGQTSLLEFSAFAVNPALPPETFRFVVPAGADVLEQ